MPLPRRPIQHQREDDSRSAFNALLPSRHIFRPEERDYGLDGEVEEFNRDFEATGRRFRVQLKATGETGPAAMRERIRHETAAYYRAQRLPVLMVRHVAPTNTFYGRWFHEFDPYYEHEGDTHVTFHWSHEDELSEDSFDELFAEVERFDRLRGVGLELPLTVALDVPPEGVHGLSRAELEVAFDAGVEHCHGVLEQTTADGQADVTAEVSEDHLRASVAGLASVTFHLGEGVYPPDTPPDAIVGDLLACIAAAIARAGHAEPAARIAVRFFGESLLSGEPALGADLAVAMVDAGRIVEVLEVADRLDQVDEDDSRAVTSAAFMEAVRAKTETLQPHEHERLEEALRARLARRLDAGRTDHAAAAAENVGTYLMRVRRSADAVEPLEQAIMLDPARESADLAQRLAAAYLLSQRYAEAVPAYDRAVELTEAPWAILDARRADALLYAGRYHEAREAFMAIETDDRRLSAWVYVKIRALDWVLETTGIDEQERQPKAAEEEARRLIGVKADDVEADAIADDVWALDAVSSLGWFNRARDLLDRGLDREAMLAYLAAAVLREGDVEAWVNVAILAMNVGDYPLFETSIIGGYDLNRTAYMAEFSRQLRVVRLDPAMRDQLLGVVRRIVAEESAEANGDEWQAE